jgi:hypothetical protein
MRGEYLNEIELRQEGKKWHILDAEYVSSWRAYHQEHAVLRPLHKDVHSIVSKLWYQFEWATLSSPVWGVGDSIRMAKRSRRRPWPKLRVITGGR